MEKELKKRVGLHNNMAITNTKSSQLILSYYLSKSSSEHMKEVVICLAPDIPLTVTSCLDGQCKAEYPTSLFTASLRFKVLVMLSFSHCQSLSSPSTHSHYINLL